MTGSAFGRVRAWSDFLPLVPLQGDDTIPGTVGNPLGGGWALHGDNEGSVVATVDEPGGVLACTTDVGDDDNIFITAGLWSPADGGMECEFRVKIVDSVATTRAAVWCGFAETLSTVTPVMPFETNGSTTTYNTGGSVGFLFDSDSTDLIWRFAAGDGTAALATVGPTGTVGGAIGIDAEATITADRWWVFKVEVYPSGLAKGFIMDTNATTNINSEMRLVGETTAALGTGDNFHATIGIENRSAANEIMELDYAYAQGWRYWAAD